MNPAINLTKGAIAMLLNGKAQGLKPVLQVTDIRLVNTQNQNSAERYRILLSGGMHLQQRMLATRRNDLVRAERVQKGSTVQVSVLQKDDRKGVIDLVTNAKQVVSSVQDVAQKVADYSEFKGQLKDSVSILATKASGGESSIVGYSPDDLTCIDKLNNVFESWMESNDKVYKSAEEKSMRFEIFKNNLKYIHERNKTLENYKLGLTVFADMSLEEFKQTFRHREFESAHVETERMHNDEEHE